MKRECFAVNLLTAVISPNISKTVTGESKSTRLEFKDGAMFVQERAALVADPSSGTVDFDGASSPLITALALMHVRPMEEFLSGTNA